MVPYEKKVVPLAPIHRKRVVPNVSAVGGPAYRAMGLYRTERSVVVGSVPLASKE